MQGGGDGNCSFALRCLCYAIGAAVSFLVMDWANPGFLNPWVLADLDGTRPNLELTTLTSKISAASYLRM